MMILNKEFTDQLISHDIVVWNGVIGVWQAIKSGYTEGDLIRLANEEEIQTYKSKR